MIRFKQPNKEAQVLQKGTLDIPAVRRAYVERRWYKLRLPRAEAPTASLDARRTLHSETAHKAWIDWTIHLHQQIHLYLRLTATLQQIGVAAFASMIGLGIQFPHFRSVLFMLSPYLLGSLLMAFMTYLREVFVFAGFIEHYETELARSTGLQVLVTERVLGAHPPNKRGSLVADLLNMTLFLVSLGISVYYSLTEGWLVAAINGVLLGLLVISFILSGSEMRQARRHVVEAARRFVSSTDPNEGTA